MLESAAYDGLQPRGLWEHFAAMNRIARPSGHEESIAAYIRAWADRLNYPLRQDDAGNLCVHVPARTGRGQAPVVILQGHLDMVCERSPDTPHDPERGDIHPVRDGDWVRAEGTTLGADNGIGVAAMMHAAENPHVARGPLDLLFTVDEETGLTGAQSLDPRILRGRILLNLDSEKDGELCVGCAGSSDATVTMRHHRSAVPSGWSGTRVRVSGLRGGHSGIDIAKPRLNAIRVLARLLQRASGVSELRLALFEGGSKRNAIPRDASAVVFVRTESKAGMLAEIARETRILQERHAATEELLSVETESTAADPSGAWTADDTSRLLDLLLTLPCGVLGMSPAIPGLVETSNNLGTAETVGDEVRIGCLARSSLDPAMEDVVNMLRSAARLAGADVSGVSGYPGWQPDLGSPTLATARAAFHRVFGHDPEITAVHAGLECGIIGERVQGMDMISFGPEIEGPHAPGERVHIGSVERFWQLLGAVLDDLSRL